ncbi:MAG: SDR family NAD(P)-dependent oxidoreductase [Proteobacteria bacterium]|nr:SDR family NAD(P)-dependent oxidoreductase [Pseudomonadota bacterium]
MNDFKGKVAVITGAASGIGRGLAEYCAKKEMKIVLADVEEKALSLAESKIKASGADIIAVVTDVSKIEDVQFLAGKTIDTFKKVDLLFNNAGVATGSSIWETTINDCKWVIDVNLWGVIYCIHEFVPIMLGQKTPCHIINTASITGLVTYHPSAIYQLSKHAIVALSEQLLHDLEIRETNIKVSVICPGFVNTNILNAERNRPDKYSNESSGTSQNSEPDETKQAFRGMMKLGMPPAILAKIVFKAIEEDKFYIFTNPEMKALVQKRMDGIMKERKPAFPPV